MKEKSWLVFVGIGLAIVAFGIYSTIFLPAGTTSGTQLDWLTSDAEVLDFVGWNFRAQGVWQLAFGIMVMISAVTGFRREERWAWYALWAVPLVLGLVTLITIWMIPITATLLALSVAALLITRPNPAAAQPA